MKLFEYQAKELFSLSGIKIPEGSIATNMQDAVEIIKKIGLPCMVKAQVLQGGRGKRGLVRRAETMEDAIAIVRELLTSRCQIGKVLIEQCVVIKEEIYLSIAIEPVKAKALIMACTEGGVEIETLAKTFPEKIMRELVDLDRGLQVFQLTDLMFRLGLKGDIAKKMTALIRSLYECFRKYDAELAEINPVFITEAGDVIAGDGKLIIDDNSLFRQPCFSKTRDYYDTDMEYESALEGIPYIQFDGDISLMCAGAGLTTTVFDLIHYEGGTVANYLEFGGPNYMKAEKAMEICLKNKSKVILIVTFGTIARADVIAEGVVAAWKRLKPDRPLVTCIRGTNEDEAIACMKAAGLECLSDTEDAVKRAVELASGRNAE